ncbi:MAG: DUF2161 family putative PD-(D/E)XK-type phosphodiesterase [Clostridia bacterium]|nr:DUF2161 family putative PD-(D/E)XK-type phosphodiesterase [Clostridia bacterium]
MVETDLYESVKLFLEELGYQVHAEVKNCDVVGKKGDELVIVELKRNLSVRLLCQAVQRQKLGVEVYLAVPKPSRYQYNQKHRELLHLLRRLELGLLYVTPEMGTTEAVLHPQPLDLKKALQSSKQKKAGLLRELEQRQLSENKGGSTGVKLLTAYREQALYVCCALSEMEQAGTKELSAATGLDAKKLNAMLGRNYYGWFERVERGVFRLSKAGEEALKQYGRAVDYYLKKLHTGAELGKE